MEIRSLSINAVEAFLLARGFTPTLAAKIAQQGCIHKLAAIHSGNDETSAVTVELRDWRVKNQNESWQPLIMREDWPDRLENHQPLQSARMAFNWALFPTQQTFHPGDRIWGWAAINLPPGTSFDLQVVWKTGKRIFMEPVEDLLCASQPSDSQLQGGEKP